MISNPPKPGTTLADRRFDLLWGAWAELGLSGWARTHGDWAVAPEPLIVQTAKLGDLDPRLRDESTDWCIRNWRYVSRIRLRNLLKDESPESKASFGEFAATVNEHAGVKWPGATQARSYRVTGRSTLPLLSQPSMIWLRLRAMFGLGARTEILRHFLSHNGGYSIATLASFTGYAKRNVAEECDALERAGVLAVNQVANRFYYYCAKPNELAAFVGDRPGVLPPWTPLFRVVDRLVDLERASQESPDRVIAVTARKVLDDIHGDLGGLGIKGPPEPRRGTSLWPQMGTWAEDLLAAWGRGRWPHAAAENDDGSAVMLQSARRSIVRHPAKTDP
jgi:hypothetical protein